MLKFASIVALLCVGCVSTVTDKVEMSSQFPAWTQDTVESMTDKCFVVSWKNGIPPMLGVPFCECYMGTVFRLLPEEDFQKVKETKEFNKEVRNIIKECSEDVFGEKV